MGGFGALRNGLKHYDRYGKIFCFAPALELEYTLDSTYDAQDYLMNRSFVEAHYGPDLQASKNSDQNPLWLIDHLTAQGIDLPKIYMATGQDDTLADVHRAIEQHLADAQADYTAKIVLGIHDWDFINRNLEQALQWLAEK